MRAFELINLLTGKQQDFAALTHDEAHAANDELREKGSICLWLPWEKK